MGSLKIQDILTNSFAYRKLYFFIFLIYVYKYINIIVVVSSKVVHVVLSKPAHDLKMNVDDVISSH